MKYISTRGKAPELGFENVLLSGLASDGGLYIPKNWPAIKYQDLPDGPYYEKAAFVIHPFVEDFLDYEQLKILTKKAYVNFPQDDAAPLKEIEEGNFLLELFILGVITLTLP